MNFSALFIRRPVGTILLTIGLAIAGIAAFFALPVAPLPQIDFPTIRVLATLPGASPDTMGSSIAAPLERRLGTIAGLTEMTSQSSVGTTQIVLQFDLGRTADGAARDVQAAINAARADLPATLRMNPTYQKINPADAPIMILSLTSETRSPSQIYDAVSAIVQQRLLQVQGVGDAELGGAALPSVRVDLNPTALARFGIPLEDVRTAITATNAERPRGILEGHGNAWVIHADAPGLTADAYRDVVIASRGGTLVRLSDVAAVYDGPEDTHTLGLFNGKRAVDVILRRQPGANIIQTVDAVRAQLPVLRGAIPSDIELSVASDLTTSIRASLLEVEVTLVISVLLVIAVVGLFLQSLRSAIVPALAIVTSLLGTLAVIYLLGFSLNNLSLMALTVATGFVVDDAIVVLENISRHVEDGLQPRQAALQGAKEVGFTVLSISVSLVAVFIPLLFMGGLPGRLFREFSITMAVAVLISLIVSLTLTPVLAALIVRAPGRRGRIAQFTERQFQRLQASYAKALDWSLANRGAVLLILAATILLNVVLLGHIRKGFFPEEDTGSIIGSLQTDQGMSFQQLQRKLQSVARVIGEDPAVQNVVAFTGGRMSGSGFLFITLTPPKGRVSADKVVDRLAPELRQVSGISTYLNPVQDLRVGGRQSNATYQYTLTAGDPDALADTVNRLEAELRKTAVITDISDDLSLGGVGAFVDIDRASASRLGITPQTIDQTLYDSFGQRQVATLYSGLNQYHVVMGLADRFTGAPEALAQVHVPAASSPAATSANSRTSSAAASSSQPSATAGPAIAGVVVGASTINTQGTTMIPLTAFASWRSGSTAAQVNHQGGIPSATISFNTAPGHSLGEAAQAIQDAQARIAAPDVQGGFAGTAQVFQKSLSSMPILILSALLAIYIVLGILYESAIHPLTALSTLPSAGVGAVIALMLAGLQFDLIGIIGLILLIGIVKKNAILIIDFALDAERRRELAPLDAIREASLLRFRPILMTTMAAALGALPLAIGFGVGAELRRPLGLAIIGGLVASQVLTLLTTPVVYLALDRFRSRNPNERLLARGHNGSSPIPA